MHVTVTYGMYSLLTAGGFSRVNYLLGFTGVGLIVIPMLFCCSNAKNDHERPPDE